MSYDSTQSTNEHIMRVQRNIFDALKNLRLRAIVHDDSKHREPEKSLYDEWQPKLRELTYGSDEYKAALAQMGPALQHHYQANSHHPEHYPDGVMGMSLFDIIEMLCDWRAANEQYGGDFLESMEKSFQRFGIEQRLGAILIKTAIELGWIEHE